MELGLKDKIALITGGSDGIGRAIAHTLAKEGATVIICARRPDVLERTVEDIRASTNSTAIGITCDITNPDHITDMFGKILSDFHRIDILVNNAGTSSAHIFEEVKDEEWEYDLDLKLFGAIRCSRAAIPHMKRSGGGRIVNITTPGGKAPAPGSVPTSVSRAAGIALTKEMSKDYASDNILVNTVCVGLIKSGQWVRRWENASQNGDSSSLENFYVNMGGKIPMGRVGEAAEVADLVAFLVSDRGSYITGTAINIDGGLSPVV